MTNIHFQRLAVIFLASAAAVSLAEADGLSTPPVKDATTAKECGACHMLYPPGLLPARSWTRLMADLQNHFGDNADLDDTTRRAIAGYLAANAADHLRGRSGKMVRGLAAGEPPLRISELPYFRKEHRRIGPAELQRRSAKSIADCKACHAGAEQGRFDDD